MWTLIDQKYIFDKHGSPCNLSELAYYSFFYKHGIKLIAVPNLGDQYVDDFFKDFPGINGVILTGGNNISPLPGESYTATSDCSIDRDNTSAALLKYAVAKDLPVLGICRGMQLINVFFGGKLERNITSTNINHDKGNHHQVQIVDRSLSLSLGTEKYSVNSYHTQGISLESLATELRPFLSSEDGLIEGIYHPAHKIAGILYHPEREQADDPATDTLIKAFTEAQLFWKYRCKE